MRQTQEILNTLLDTMLADDFEEYIDNRYRYMKAIAQALYTLEVESLESSKNQVVK